MSTICRHTNDFKKDAVQYVEEHTDMTLQRAAEYLGMPKESLYGWGEAYESSVM